MCYHCVFYSGVYAYFWLHCVLYACIIGLLFVMSQQNFLLTYLLKPSPSLVVFARIEMLAAMILSRL